MSSSQSHGNLHRLHSKKEFTPILAGDVLFPEEVSVPICVPCGHAISPEINAFKLHCINRHSMTEADAQNLFDCCSPTWRSKPHPLRSIYTMRTRRITNSPLPRLPYLPVVFVFSCPYCLFLSSSADGVRRHVGREHSECKVPAIASIEKLRGQSLWRKVDMRCYWTIRDEVCMTASETLYNRNGISTRKVFAPLVMDTEDESTTAVRGAFATYSRLDEKMEVLGISWKDAIMLTSGIRRSRQQADSYGDVLDERLKSSMLGMVREMLRGGRTIMTDRTLSSFYRRIMTIVACPGAISKTRSFQFATVSTERGKYSNLTCRLILMALRVVVLKCRNDPLGKLIPMSDEIFDRSFDLLEKGMDEMNTEDQNVSNIGEEGIITPERIGNCTYLSESDDDDNSTVTTEETDNVDNADQADDIPRNLEEKPKSPITDRSHLNAKLISKLLRAVLFEEQDLENDAECSFIACFLACIGIIQHGNGSMQLALGVQVSPTLAAISYSLSVSSLLFIVHDYNQTGRKEEMKYIENCMRPHGYLGVHVLVSLFADCRRTRAQESSVICFSNCIAHKELSCGIVGNVHVTPNLIGNVVRSMQKRMFELLFSPIFGMTSSVKETFHVQTLLKDISAMVDDESCNTALYWFVVDHRNRACTSRCASICVDISSKMTSRKASEKNALTNISSYMQLINEFEGLLQCCIFLSGGMSGRCRETANEPIKNTKEGRRRGLLFVNGFLTIVPGQTKISWSSPTGCLVSRHPDECTALLFKIFGVLVQPLGVAIARLLGKDRDVRFILGRVEDRNNSSKLMASLWRRHGLHFSSSQYRQWCGGFAKMYQLECNSESFQRQPSTLSSFLQLQAGHSIVSARLNYGVQNFDSIYQGKLTKREVELFMEVSRLWHKATNLCEWSHVSCYMLKDALGSDDCEKMVSLSVKIEDVCRGELVKSGTKQHHGTGSPNSHSLQSSLDLVDIGSTPGTDNDDTVQIPVDRRKVKGQLTIENTHGNMANPNESPDVETSSLKDARRGEKLKILDEDLTFALSLGCAVPDPLFRSDVQKRGLRYIMERAGDIMVVDRTGGGKTALVFGPCKTENLVTLLLIPFRALMNDMEMRAKKIGLQTSRVRDVGNSNGIPSSGLCLVAIEQIQQTRYQEFVKILFQMNRLARIVVDECHTALVSSGFRDESMSFLKVARPDGVTCPVVLLTATAPLKFTKSLLDCHGLVKDTTKILRGDLRRINVIIRKVKLSNGKPKTAFSEATKYVRSIVASTEFGHGRHLVAVLTKLDGRVLADEFSSDISITSHRSKIIRYDSSLQDDERKRSVDIWNAGCDNETDNVIMVCTDGFLVGIDASDVRSIVVVGCSRSLVEFAQAIGRLGRDGQESLAVVLYHPFHLKRARSKNDIRQVLLEDFQTFIEDEKSCLCVECASYNGSELASSSDTEWLCGKCSNCSTSWPLSMTPMNISSMPTLSAPEQMVNHFKDESITFRANKNFDFPVVLACNVQREIDKLREVGLRLLHHCVPCVLKNGISCTSNTSLAGPLVHGNRCYWGRCHRCFSDNHAADVCTSTELPLENRVACRFCFLSYASGRMLHYGTNTSQNEFGSLSQCPYKNIFSVCMAVWSEPKLKSELLSFIDSEKIGTMNGNATGREYFDWLVKDMPCSSCGIFVVSRYISWALDRNVI